jgi:hypothetical protein
MKATAMDVARYFIAAADSDEGISNLKLLPDYALSSANFKSL